MTVEDLQVGLDMTVEADLQVRLPMKAEH